MTTPSSDKLHDLARALRDLVGRATSDRAELDEWYAAARRLQEWIRADPDLSDAVPHFVWHYLADADIRRKDPAYDLEQAQCLMEIVDSLERGELPAG